MRRSAYVAEDANSDIRGPYRNGQSRNANAMVRGDPARSDAEDVRLSEHRDAYPHLLRRTLHPDDQIRAAGAGDDAGIRDREAAVGRRSRRCRSERERGETEGDEVWKPVLHEKDAREDRGSSLA